MNQTVVDKLEVINNATINMYMKNLEIGQSPFEGWHVLPGVMDFLNSPVIELNFNCTYQKITN